MIIGKRVIIATIFGFIAGLICLSLGMLAYPDMKYSAISIGWVLINRTLIGFVIGISAWRINWALQGILLGGIIGL